VALRVFISYRHDDSAGHAGRVCDLLRQELGSDLLFMDVDAIRLGVNFVKVLGEEVAKCDVLLAIMGAGWLDARDEDGHRRLDNPHDFIRVEIAAALKRDIPVIPIVLEGTRVPRVDQLPDDLRDLAVRNALAVHHASFHSDMARLIRELKGPQSPEQPAPATPFELPSRLHAPSKNWWFWLMRGIAAIVFGVSMSIEPFGSSSFFVLYVIVDGIVALVAAFTTKPEPPWWLVVVGLVGIAAAFVLPIWPDIGEDKIIGAWAIAHGILESIGALKLRKQIDNELWLILAGTLSVFFGITILLLAVDHPERLYVASPYVGPYAILFGVLLIALSFRLRKHTLAVKVATTAIPRG
jgi:uncharacterized membrane protein HdeD (DUF308 family)